MGDAKMTAEERLRTHKRPADCFDMDWLVVDHDTAIRIAEAHAAEVVKERDAALRKLEDARMRREADTLAYVKVMQERDEALARVAELKEEVDRLRAVEPLVTLARSIIRCCPERQATSTFEYRIACHCLSDDWDAAVAADKAACVALDSTTLSAQPVESELKPCPFCGGTDLERDSSESSPHDIAVSCQTCFARGPNTCTYGQPKGSYDTGADWNKRV